MTSRAGEPPRIVWDLDDTLNDLMREWLKWHFTRQPSRGRLVRFAELVDNPPHHLLGLTLEEYQESLDQFRLSNGARDLLPEPEVLDWFQARGCDFEHHVLTARPTATVAPAAEWVFRHFGRWIRHFHFVPSSRGGAGRTDRQITKHDVIEQLGGVDFFVDDSPETLHAARHVARICLLPPQPWNRSKGTIAEVLAVLLPPATN